MHRETQSRVTPWAFLIVSMCMASFGIGEVPGVTDVKDQPLTTRQLVYQAIEHNPGIHFRELCRELDKQTGVVQYHVGILEKTNRIRAHADGRYKRFFVADQDHEDGHDQELHTVVASMMQRETPARILRILEAAPEPVNHGALARALGVTSQAITWNCHRLVKQGVITESKEGRQKFYAVTDQVAEIVQEL